ncbi:serine hydrolase [Segniliparus rugosus]|uniref:serine hydrolase n=1 Tax=Segniliparus rugosus TaxID=286804 RepID=UPI0001F0380B|nr:serine hydrolase [Segniliparus rugosus]
MRQLLRACATAGCAALLAAPLAWAEPDEGEEAGARGSCSAASADGAGASDLDCDLQSRVAKANAYIATRPGVVSYVLRDRKTGATYHSQHASELIYTASTIKLLIATDLLVRQRAGQLTLTGPDKDLMHQMLNFSDNDAANSLWDKYNGPGGTTLLRVFQSYGFIDEINQHSPSASSMYWGNHKATADDLGRLMLYVLEQTDPADRAYLLGEMRGVASNQQWGVWGAGAAMSPGNKNGWCEEPTGWVANSVGFAGPDERYMLAIMNNLAGAGGQAEGWATDTQVASILLAGRADDIG